MVENSMQRRLTTNSENILSPENQTTKVIDLSKQMLKDEIEKGLVQLDLSTSNYQT